MALSTTSDFANAIYMFLWWMENRTGITVGNYNQDGSVQVSPWVYEVLRYGYNPQDTTNYGPASDYESSDGLTVQAWPEGISPTEAADEADLTTIVTGYLAYKITRLGNDTNDVTATVGS
jgi:hypothetical protein